ncbi:MAG: hypothetical protein KAJ37_02855 [Candidatus Krumholzibacteria bacterium]|nr:hypothetical protein [Candidatus Krumholzibacteria bacterium]
MKKYLRYQTLLIAALALCALVIGTGVQAQNDGQGTLTRDRGQDGVGDVTRDQARDGAQQHDRDRDRDRAKAEMHGRIDAAPGLTTEERGQMHANLDACFDLGVSEAGVGAVFPGEENRHRVSAQAMLRLQNRVMTASREGLDVESMLAKVQEGRTKGVPEPLLEQACERMENHVRTANRIMEKAKEEGFEAPQDQTQNRRMQKEMAQQMWRGMNEEGLDHLCDQARLRLRDGSCSLDDLTAASETATRLHEEGIATDRAVHVVGEALRRGYGTHEMHQLRFMVTARHQQGGPIDGFLADMEYCLGEGMGSQEMYRHMWQNGWMGPGDMHGPGGCNNIDDVGHGGPAHHGGMGGDDHHGGMDDDDHHGGMGG